jgi:peptidoglycan/LPS O-acetylase OafA/YrhL
VPGVPERVAYVDGLRGLAALAVLGFHATHYWCKGLAPDNPFAFFFRLGTYGVDLFFVLSGFCLAYPFLRTGRPLDVVRYASRRIVRILPPYYAAIAVLAVALVAAGTVPDFWSILTQALFLDRDARFLSVTFWTLPLEIRWYFIFPLVLWLWTVSPRAFFVLAGVAVVAFQLTTAGAMDLYALPAFMLGIAAADFSLHESLPLRSIALLAGALLAAALVLDWVSGPPKYVPPFNGVDVRDTLPPLRILWQLVAFAWVLLASSWRPLQRVLGVPPLALAGAASYSIYLIHVPVVQAVHVHFPALGPLLESLASAVAGIAAGLAFWRVFEFPFVETSLKGVAIAKVEPVVARIFAWLRLPSVVRLDHHERALVAKAAEIAAPPVVPVGLS